MESFSEKQGPMWQTGKGVSSAFYDRNPVELVQLGSNSLKKPTDSAFRLTPVDRMARLDL